jgi:hypothetical protein
MNANKKIPVFYSCRFALFAGKQISTSVIRVLLAVRELALPANDANEPE